MEMKKILEKHLGITVFKILFGLTSFLLFNSCLSRSFDATNQSYIINDTKDTLYCTIFGDSNLTDSAVDYIPPHTKVLLGNGQYTEFEFLRQIRNFGDSVNIYIDKNRDSCVCVWYPPLQQLPDSIHSYYNENSWEIKKGGRKNKYTISTFTIREEDIKQ